MSGDIGLFWNLENADAAVVSNDLATDAGLETAVLLSLFLDRRLEDSDTPPDGTDDRRGWWADAFPANPGDQIGSLLWTLSREKLNQATADRAKEYAEQALQWMIDDLVASEIDVITEIQGPGMLAIEVDIYRPTSKPAKFRFQYNWQAQAAQRG